MSAELSTNPSQLPAGGDTPDSAKPAADKAAAQAGANGSLKQRAKRGTMIFVLSQVIGQLMRLASNLLLTRLLMPEHFGLMALVNIYVSGINMFSDIGIRPSIVQNKMGDDPRFLNTAWTMQVMRGFGVWAVACLLAYPVAVGIYDEPQLAQLLPVAALSAIVLGFQSTKTFTANRHLLLGREMAMQLGSNLLGIALMALLAWIYQSVWALVIGTVFNAALRSALSHVIFPGPNNRFAWDKESLGELIKFGKWVFMGTVVVFFANNLDRLLLGKLITTELLGIYQIAFMLSSLPSMLFKRFGNSVVFPIVSRQADKDRSVIRKKLLYHQRRLAVLMAIPTLGLIIAGDWVVQLGWDPRYGQAGWMTSVLGIGMWVGMLRATTQPALLAFGKPQYSMFGNIGRIVWVVLAAWLSYTLIDDPNYQLFVFLIAFGLSELPAYLIIEIGSCREKISVWHQDLWMTAVLLVVAGVLIFGRYELIDGKFPFDPHPEPAVPAQVQQLEQA